MPKKKYNAGKLLQELKDKGLNVVGVSSEGRVDWSDKPSDVDMFLADEVKNKHKDEEVVPTNAKLPNPVENIEGIYKTLKYVSDKGLDLGPDAKVWMSKVEKILSK